MENLLKLKSEIVAECDAITNQDGQAEIDSKVAEYREKLTADYKEKKEQALETRAAEIKTIDRVIERLKKQSDVIVVEQAEQGGNT